MLEKVFLQILNMSFTASFVILFILLARTFLQKLPKVFSYALWGVVLFRLVCPFSFGSVFSLLPNKTNAISPDIIYQTAPTIDTGIPVINNNIQQLLPVVPPTASANPLQIWIFIGTIVWLLGMAILLIYSIAPLMRLQKCLENAVYEKNNIYLSGHLDTPFVMGIIRPKIYLPASLTGEEKRYILLHEQMHIKRFDHIVKIVSFFALCLHWFNPLVWVAFIVSGRDMEMSCDETVIKELGGGIKKEYSSSLLTLATGRRIIGGTPLTFGGGNTRGRIKNVLNYKKPAFWNVAVALVLCIVLAGCLITNPRTHANVSDFSIEVNGTTVELGNTGILFQKKLSSKQIVNETTGEIRVVEDYEGFSLARDGQQKIIQIEILSGNALTHRQITIGSTREDVLSAYPEIIPEEQKALALWFEDEESIIEFYFLDDPAIVSSINIYRKVIDNMLPPLVEVTPVPTEELWQARTKYIGDNSAVGRIISLLQLPEGVVYDSFELHTGKHPYAVAVNYKTNTETRNFYAGADQQAPFLINALIMFSLIENVELITFRLHDGLCDAYSMQYTDEMAKATLGKGYREESGTLEGFSLVLQKILEKESADTGEIGKQKDDEGLTFWVKPDEPPQVIGNTAAAIWLKSFMGARVPAASRLSDYNITKVDVIVGEPKAGVKWEDMAYQYVVRIRYNIATATEEYFNPGDGVSGKGDFEGLFVELCVKVKTTDGGGYQIVSAGTDGGEQEFANP
ncbi:MAG TPA: DUF4825 domain-containing protein [Firmicutes bacterium]|nr:DUF4825 domain-containing protein [Bacillota bacterium]